MKIEKEFDTPKGFLIRGDIEPGEELKEVLDILMSGKQNYDCFRYLAEYFSTHIDKPDQIDPQAIRWITLALKKIASGDSPKQALGIKKKVGREKNDFSLCAKVAACMELSMRKGVKKNKAIQETSEILHKDPRHIQRILGKKIRLDVSEMDTESLHCLALKGMDMKFLVSEDE